MRGKNVHFRSLVLSLGLLLGYGIFAYLLFVEQSILWSMLTYGLLFVVLIFLAIDGKKIKKSNFFPALVLLASILQVIFYQQARQLNLAIWLSLLGIGIIYRDLT